MMDTTIQLSVCSGCVGIGLFVQMRLCEVLDLTDANELSDGLLTKRSKESRINHQSESKAKEQGIDFVHVTFPDLKRKCASDIEGVKQKAAATRMRVCCKFMM